MLPDDAVNAYGTPEAHGGDPRSPSLDAAVEGFVPPPNEHFTGACPCGCGVRWRDGVQLLGFDHAAAVADDYAGRLRRIRAAAQSDADLAELPALRGFLLAETEPVDG